MILYWHQKMFRDIQRVMEQVDGSNNYRQDKMFVVIQNNGIVVETACINEYGGEYNNDDRQFIPYKRLSNYVMRKLFL